MRRLVPFLLFLPFTACIERTPAADDDSPLECVPADCGRNPSVEECPDGSPRARCVAQDDVCQWQVARCAEPVEPEPVEPEPPIVECTPDACGPLPDGAACPDGFDSQAECIETREGCDWRTECVPASACAGECGAPPAGEPCAPDERSVQECRETREGCIWHSACEALECEPTDCPDNPVLPNCEHTIECVPLEGSCDWLIECVPPTCEQQWDPGPCLAVQAVWWFNSATFECEVQQYGGCGGNENRFETEEACYQTCGVLGGEAPDPEQGD